MTIYTEGALYALTLSELVHLCEERQVAPLSGNPRWKKNYVPALLAAQETHKVSILPEPAVDAANPVNDELFSPEPSPWEEETESDMDQPISAPLPPVQEQEEGSTMSSPNTVVVYPIVFLLLMTWALLQVLIGIASVVIFCLKQVAQHADEQATKRLELFRSSSSPCLPATA